VGGLAGSLHWFAGEVKWFVYLRGFMFAWNLLLALIPLALAGVLFRPGIRRTSWWWVGLVAFVLFLPNAAYVLTDVVHLLDDVRSTSSDLALITVHLPAYLIFLGLGFSCYVLALMKLQAYLAATKPGLPWLPVEFALHAVVAAGMFLGRIKRLNSWDVLGSPGTITESVPDLASRFPLLFIGFTFVVLVVLTTLARPTLRAALVGGQRTVRRLGGMFGPAAG
jgi:uncharacterized membrane protein